MGHDVPYQPPPDEYANHLAVPEPERPQLRRAHWLLLILLVLCVVPRVVMLLRIPSVCPDGVLYIRLAQAIDAGDWRSGLRDITLNLYPFLLVGLHRLGLGWELAAGLWGIAASSLVILPLWGWVRRQFDDRVALVACLLYAVNPKFIEWSPEVMRDPTFWLLFMLAIYWLWRSVTEVRCGYFVAGAVAIALASLTRTEGLFLLIPLTLWTFWRVLALRTDRKKLMLVAILCLVVFPSLLVAANVAWACCHSGWTALPLSPLARVVPWLGSLVGHSSGIEGLEKPLGFSRMLCIFVPTMTRGLSSVFALLMFGGIWGWRRVWIRRDHQPLFYVAIVTVLGIWIQMGYDRNICPRYALPIVLMASPFAALGLLGLLGRLSRIANWLQWNPRLQQALLAVTVVLVPIINLGDAMSSNVKYFETRRMAADLGSWVRNKYPQLPAIVGPVGITPIISYYAHNAPYLPFRWDAPDDSIIAMIEQSRASVVLLQPARELTDERCAVLAARLKTSGLAPVDGSELPPTCDGLRVFVRLPQETRMVREPSQVY